MLTLKRIDAWGQLALIITCLALTLVLPGDMFFWSYFIVGGWQVASTLVQLFNHRKWPEHHTRKVYVWFLLISALTVPIGSFVVLLFVAPFTAIWYLFISFKELNVWEARHLIQLK